MRAPWKFLNSVMFYPNILFFHIKHLNVKHKKYSNKVYI